MHLFVKQEIFNMKNNAQMHVNKGKGDMLENSSNIHTICQKRMLLK